MISPQIMDTDKHGFHPGEQGGKKDGHGTQAPWLITFADLLSVLFGFFVLLFTMSEIDPRKVEIAVASIASQFTSQSVSNDEIINRNKTLDVTKEAQVRVASAFQDAFAVARMERIEKGNVLRVRLAADTLFVPGTPTVRTDKQTFIERLSDAVSQKEEGRRAELEIIIGSGPTLPMLRSDAPATLEMRRVGAFVRDLRQRGVPAEALVAGLSPGDIGQIEFRFSSRIESRSKVTFDQLAGD